MGQKIKHSNEKSELQEENEQLKLQLKTAVTAMEELQGRENTTNEKKDNKEESRAEWCDKYEVKQGNQDAFYCRGCNQYQNGDLKVIWNNCDCKNYCRECAFTYVSDEIMNKKHIRIKCPICNDKYIDDNDIALLDQNGQLLRRYQALVQIVFNEEEQRLVPTMKGDAYEFECERIKCGYKAHLDDWQKYNMSYLICKGCGTGYCKECGHTSTFHLGLVSCKVARERAMNVRKWLQCANCSSWIRNDSSMFFSFVILCVV